MIETQERELLTRADLVFVHSGGLQQLYASQTRRPMKLVPSAADVSLFQSTKLVHPDIVDLPKPRLGLSGTLDARVDVALLEQLMSRKPGWSLVLIGSARPRRIDLAGLLALPNVYDLGKRPFTDLPALLNGMDVLLIPYRRSELTEFISPLKLYEYLANGAPIVSTPLPEAQPLAEWVYFAESPEEFIRAVERALQEDKPERRADRRRAAQVHTWDQRVDILWEAVEAVLREKERAAA